MVLIYKNCRFSSNLYEFSNNYLVKPLKKCGIS